MSRLISAIVTVYNRAGMVTAALASLDLDGPNRLEIIVVDDGSTDGSQQVVGGMDDNRIRLIRHDRNRGIPAARNTGLEAAEGDYIAWLDSDDLARPGRLDSQIRFLDAHPEIAMIGASAGRITRDGRARRGARVPLMAHEDICAQLLFRSAFQQSSIIGRAAILKAYPYREAFPVCEDVDMFVRLTADHRVANLAEILVERRQHAGQTVKQQSAAIRERKGEIFRHSLGRLGIVPDDQELQRHVMLGNLKNEPVSRAMLDWSEAWLDRIGAANRLAQVYDQAALDFVSSRLWLLASRNALNGPGRRHALARIARSPLTRGMLNRRGRAWLCQASRVRLAGR